MLTEQESAFQIDKRLKMDKSRTQLGVLTNAKGRGLGWGGM